MSILVVLAHPSPDSFNHAIARAACEALRAAGHDVVFHDLYAEAFDPVLPACEVPCEGAVDPVVEQHCAELVAAHGIVIVHPNWWGQPPAILKGWVDRVVRPGVAYRFLEGDNGEGVPVGLLKARAAVVFNTGNTPTQRETEVFGDPLERLWRDCIFDLCGVRCVHRRLLGVLVTSTLEQRQAWLREVADLVVECFPEPS